MPIKRGEEHHRAVLTDEQVVEMRRLVEAGACMSCAAKLVGAYDGRHRHEYMRARDAIQGVTWKHVGRSA